MSAPTQDTRNLYEIPSMAQRRKPVNGIARVGSQARRQDQAGVDEGRHDNPDDQFAYPPEAPEVPRGPPISYKQPYGGEPIGQQPTRSFSQRARGQMLAQEALEDEEYWDDHDNIPSQMRVPEEARKPAARTPIHPPVRNGLNEAMREHEVRRGPSQRQPDIDHTSPLNSVHPIPKAPRDHSRRLRHSADIAPLKVDVSSPTSRSNTVRGSKNFGDDQVRDWAADRSPLQKLEVKLNDISKEEKRARVEEAEMLLRESKAGRSGKGFIREEPAAAQRSMSTKEAPPEPRKLHKAAPARRLSDTTGDGLQQSPGGEPQQLDARRPVARRRAELHEQEQLPDKAPISGKDVIYPNQPTGQQDRARESDQTHSAYGTDRTVSSMKARKEVFQEPAGVGQAHPAHDPRLTQALARSQEPRLPPQDQGSRGQEGVRTVASQRQAAVAQSIPSNITRAVSLQQHQPQPLFAEDQDMSRPGPIRQTNSSHKAALAEATAAVGPAGATATSSVKRDNSRKLQKAPPANLNRDAYAASERPRSMDANAMRASAYADVPRFSTKVSTQDPKVEFYYKGMPKQVDVQRSNSQRAPEPVGLGLMDSPVVEQNSVPNRQRQTSVSFKVPFDKARPVNEWKQAGTVRLVLGDLAIATAGEHDQAWWEEKGSSRRRSKRSSGTAPAADAYSRQDPRKVEFTPPLYLKCGPLLRYTGMRRDRVDSQAGKTGDSASRETWRGSVTIVTQDSHSSYEEVPTLRLFSQPRDLLPPPPEQVQGDELAPEYIDPIAGLTKVSRRGQTLYVKPVDHLEEGKDLSRIENEDGLFEMSPSPLDNSQGAAQPNTRTRGIDGETLGKYREVKGVRLYADIERDVTFWRFNIEVELGDQQAHIAYRINRGPPVGFWVPARGQTMNIMFHSCNGFSLSVNSDQFGGPDPLWRDVLNTHQTRPFHVMIGGGDQLYNDRVMVDTKHFAAWTHLKNPHDKHHAPFTDEMREELESFYLNRYAMWFSQGLFGLANSQIPMVNIYDDHDIIDGFGSYPDDFQRAPVFSGIGNIAFKYYMLFQHQSVPEETHADEPSWLLGAKPGPYIQQLSRSVFLNLGQNVAFLGLDCRTEREVSAAIQAGLRTLLTGISVTLY
jgi:PhoD related phosphatase